MKIFRLLCLGWIGSMIALPVLSQPCERSLLISTTEIREAQADLALAKQNYERYSRLYQEGAISKLAVIRVQEELRTQQRFLAAVDRCSKATRDDTTKVVEMRYERLLWLYRMGAVPRSEVDRAELDYRAAQKRESATNPAQSELEAAQARLKQAELLYQRSLLLNEAGAISRSQVDQAELDYRSTQTRVEQLRRR
ncbi:hypothetical protein ACKFKF_07525 [Phormidesmis sp. 146-12]